MVIEKVLKQLTINWVTDYYLKDSFKQFHYKLNASFVICLNYFLFFYKYKFYVLDLLFKKQILEEYKE